MRHLDRVRPPVCLGMPKDTHGDPRIGAKLVPSLRLPRLHVGRRSTVAEGDTPSAVALEEERKLDAEAQGGRVRARRQTESEKAAAAVGRGGGVHSVRLCEGALGMGPRKAGGGGGDREEVRTVVGTPNLRRSYVSTAPIACRVLNLEMDEITTTEIQRALPRLRGALKRDAGAGELGMIPYRR